MRCDDCDFAEWKRTSNGRLHPDKSGYCTRLRKHPLDLRIPAAFYWGAYGRDPQPSGGYITRSNDLQKKCVFKSVTKSEK